MASRVVGEVGSVGVKSTVEAEAIHPFPPVYVRGWVAAPTPAITLDTLSMPEDAAYFVPLPVSRGAVLKALAVGINASGTSGSATVRLGLYADDDYRPGAKMDLDGGTGESMTVDTNSSAANLRTLTTPVRLLPGLYWIAVVAQDPSAAGVPIVRSAIADLLAVSQPSTSPAPIAALAQLVMTTRIAGFGQVPSSGPPPVPGVPGALPDSGVGINYATDEVPRLAAYFASI